MCNSLLFCRCSFLRTNMLAFGFSDLSALWSLRHRISPIKREATESEVVVVCDFTSQHWKCWSRELATRGFVGSQIIVSLQGIIQAYKSGITIQGNTTSLGRWDLSGSFFLSILAITTIGYGNLSPSTAAGRIFCILFALFGIPLNLVVLNEIGQLMLLGVQHCALTWEHCEIASLLIKTCALVTGLLLFLLLPPLLFSDKGWSYEEDFYYSFITLSTIGFGDYVVGMNPDHTYPGWYKNVIISLWILFGMAWLALVIKFCINFLESPSDFCQCNKKSTEMAEDLMDGNKNSMTGLHNVEISKCDGSFKHQWFQHYPVANVNKGYFNLETD
uniref:Potassium channel domain-containing protein n=1 Tax=Accipiter nisus TaxID=211598 RepID=A0A8B9N6P3_9AVES